MGIKCYPLLRVFALGKAFAGLGMIGVGFWLGSTDETDVVDCNSIEAVCPPAFEQLLVDLQASGDLTSKEAEIQAYCDCLTGCLNYFQVFEEERENPVPDNCYVLSSHLVPTDRRLGFARGNVSVDALATAARKLYSAFEDSSVGGPPRALGRRLQEPEPAIESDAVCVTCQEAAESPLFESLAGICFVAGIASITLAACEFMELKWHGTMYACCVLLTDVTVGTILVGAVMVAFWGWSISSLLCEPESQDEIFEKAGEESTNGDPDTAAAYAQFIRTLMEPSFEGLCALAPKFGLSMWTLGFGATFTEISFLVTMCICCGFTDDGESAHPQDVQAVQLQRMLNNDDDEFSS